MSSLRENFETLQKQLEDKASIAAPGDKPLYYLVFSPQEILEVKRLTPAWKASLGNAGWDVTAFSLQGFLRQFFRVAKVRSIWLKRDAQAPLDWAATNQSLANSLGHGALKDALLAQLKELKTKPNALLLITDLEALHPYIRFGPIESQLYGSINVPTVVLYPGVRSGESSLSFLGFYPDDGNYRSVHIGG